VRDNTVTFCSVCVVRAVHTLDFRLVTNETSNKWRPVERSCNDRDSCFLQDLYIFPHAVVANGKVRKSLHGCNLVTKELNIDNNYIRKFVSK
jgi:hypothetical protein